MIKKLELSDPHSCLNKAREDEMIFVLLERDLAAPLAIRQWMARRIQLGKNKVRDPQIIEAGACAQYMYNRSLTHRDLAALEKPPRIIPTNLNEFATECHDDNIRWWQNPADKQAILRNDGELLMHMVAELAEGFEGLRSNAMDQHLPHRRSIEVELVDCLIRLFDYAGARGYDLQSAYEEKRLYNAVRADHRHENRLAEGGKKF